MRWRKHYNRIVRRFAILPVKAHPPGEVVETEYRWLETVYLKQTRDWIGGIFPVWVNYEFATAGQYSTYLTMRKNETKDKEVPPET